MAGDEIPIEVELELNQASFRRLQKQLLELGHQESEGTFTTGEVRHAVLAAQAGTPEDGLAVLRQFRHIQIAAQDMAAAMKLAADAAGKSAREFARADFRQGRGSVSRSYTAGLIGPERVAERREIQRIGGQAGTILGLRGSGYDDSDKSVYQLARDQAKIKTRTDAFRVGAQVATGFAPNQIQFEGEAIRAKKQIERYFTDVAAHLAAGNANPDLEHLVNTYDATLIPKALAKLAKIGKTDEARAIAADAEAQSPQPSRSFRVEDLTSRNRRRQELAHRRLAQDIIAGETIPDDVRNQIKPSILADETRKEQERLTNQRRRNANEAVRSAREQSLAQLASEDPDVQAAGYRSAELARRRARDAQVYRDYLRGVPTDPSVLQGLDPETVRAENDRARRKYNSQQARANAEEARRRFGTGADTSEFQAADLQSKNEGLRRAAHARLAKDVLAGRGVDPLAVQSIDPAIFAQEAEKIRQRQRTDSRRAKRQADQDLQDQALAQIGSEDPAVRAEGIKTAELLRRREQDRKIYRSHLSGNAVDPGVLAGIPQDIKDQEELTSSRKQARDKLRGIIEAAQADAGVLDDIERYTKELLKADRFNALARKEIADAELAGKRLPAGATANLTQTDREAAITRQARAQESELAKQRRDQVAALNKQVEKQVGPLEETIRYEQALGKARERERNAYHDAAAALARDQTIGPITQSRAHAEAAISQYDPGLLRRAELEHQQDELAQRRAEHSRAQNAYFGDPDVPFLQRAKAGITGQVPGGITEKQPFGADFLRGLFGKEGSLEGALGQAVKFSVLYGSLYKLQSLVTGGFAAAAASASQYEDALVALSVATGKSVEANEELASSTSKIATAYGYLPNQGVTAAAQAVGLYGLNDMSEQDRNAVAGQSTAVAARIGRLSGQDIGSVQQNIAGLVRSYDLPALDQGRIEDMLSVVQRQTGSQPGDLLSAATQLGVISTEAGYDLADTFAMISQAQRMTGQTANAVAGQLSQSLSRAGDPATKAAFASVGVDVINTSFKDQVAQLAGLRDTVDPDTFKRVVQSVGRSRSGATFDVLLGQQGVIQDIAGQARTAPAGAGKENFDRSMDTLSGQFLQLKGSLAEIGVSIAQSGLLTHIVHLAVVLNGMATIVENVVGLYSELPKPLRDAIVWGTEFAAVLWLMKQAGKASLIAGAIGGVAGKIPGLAKLGGVLGLGGAAAEAGAGAAAEAGAGTAAGAGAATLAPVAAVVALAAAAWGVGATFLGGSRQHERTRDAFDSARAAAAGAADATEKRDAASKYEEAAKAAQKEQEVSLESFMKQGFLPLGQQIAKFATGTSPGARAEAAGFANAAALRKQAADLDAAAKSAAKANPAAAFAEFSSVDAVSQSLSLLATQGLSAKRQLDALNLAFEDMIELSKSGAATAGIIKAGQEEAFTTRVAAAPGKAVGNLMDRYQNQRSAFEESWWDELWLTAVDDSGERKATDARGRDEAQRGIDALKGIDLEGLQSDTAALVSDVVATAPRDAHGQVLLTKKNLERIKVGSRKKIEDEYGKNLPAEVLNALINESARTSIDAMSGTVADLTTPQGILAYADSAQKVAAQAAQNAGSAAVLTAGENTAESAAALQALQTQKNNVLEAAKNLPEGTEDERTFKANFIADQIELYDGQIRKATKAALDGRFADLDAATKVAQSGHALDDEFGRAAEDYLTSVAKLDILNAGATDAFDAIKAADRIIYGKVTDQITQGTALITAAGGYSTAVAGGRPDLAARYSTAVAGGRPDLTTEHLHDQAIAAALAPANNYGWVTNGATARPDLTLQSQRLVPPPPTEPPPTEPQGDQAIAAALAPANNYGWVTNPATARPDLTLQGQGLLPTPPTTPPGRASAPPASQPPNTLEGQLTSTVGIDKNSPEYLQRQAEVNESQLKIDQFRRQSEKNRRLLALASNDTVGIDQADVDEAKDLVNDALKRQKDNKAKGADPLIQESDVALVRQRKLALREKQNKQAQDQATVANQDYALSLDVTDPLAEANIALDASNRNLELAQKGIGDLRAAQLAHRKNQQEVLEAQVELDAQMRDDYDRTDPVARAQAALDQLNAKLAITTDPKARKVLTNQITDASIDKEMAESQQTIKDIDDLETVGRVSHQVAQAARVKERDRLKAEMVDMDKSTTGYRARYDREMELEKEIKSASEQFSGQFNLRDIKLPTVYEIRRSLGTDTSDISGAAGGTVNNVRIDGADFARVVAYLHTIFGKQVGRTRSVSTRTVG